MPEREAAAGWRPSATSSAIRRLSLSRLIAHSAVLRFLYRSWSKPEGRAPREPLRRRAVWLSDFSGMVCRVPRCRRYWRQGLRSYPIQDAVDNLTVVPPPAAPTATHGQEQPQPFPRLVRRIPATGHAAENEFCRLIGTAYASVIDDTAYPT